MWLLHHYIMLCNTRQSFCIFYIIIILLLPPLHHFVYWIIQSNNTMTHSTFIRIVSRTWFSVSRTDPIPLNVPREQKTRERSSARIAGPSRHTHTHTHTHTSRHGHIHLVSCAYRFQVVLKWVTSCRLYLSGGKPK